MSKQNQISLKPKLATLLIFIFVFLSFMVFGTVKKLSVKEMTKKASLIVLGTVERTRSQLDEVNGGLRIFTYVYIDVEKYIKGFGGRQIEIKVPGGKVGDIAEWVENMPQFTAGEKVIVFLRPEFFQVVGLDQGKFSIKDNKVLGLDISVNEFIYMIQKLCKKSHFEDLIF